MQGGAVNERFFGNHVECTAYGRFMCAEEQHIAVSRSHVLSFYRIPAVDTATPTYTATGHQKSLQLVKRLRLDGKITSLHCIPYASFALEDDEDDEILNKDIDRRPEKVDTEFDMEIYSENAKLKSEKLKNISDNAVPDSNKVVEPLDYLVLAFEHAKVSSF
jgi:hypothetical protein